MLTHGGSCGALTAARLLCGGQVGNILPHKLQTTLPQGFPIQAVKILVTSVTV
jgi:hypothetical protein